MDPRNADSEHPGALHVKSLGKGRAHVGVEDVGPSKASKPDTPTPEPRRQKGRVGKPGRARREKLQRLSDPGSTPPSPVPSSAQARPSAGSQVIGTRPFRPRPTNCRRSPSLRPRPIPPRSRLLCRPLPQGHSQGRFGAPRGGAGRGGATAPAAPPTFPRNAECECCPFPSLPRPGALRVPAEPGQTCSPTACQRRASGAAGGCWRGPRPGSARAPRRPRCWCRCARCAASRRCSTRCGPAGWPGATRVTSGTPAGNSCPFWKDRRDLSKALRLSEPGFPPLGNGSGVAGAPVWSPRRAPRSACRTTSGWGHLSEMRPPL